MNNNFNNYGFPVNNNPFMNQPNGVGGGNTPYFAPTKPMEYDGYFGSNPEPPKPSFMDKLSGFFERYGGSILKWGLALVGLGGGIAFVKNYRDTDVSYGKGTQKPDDNAGFMPKFKYAVCNFFSSDLGWLKPHTAGAKEADKTEATQQSSTSTPTTSAQAGKDDAMTKQIEETTKKLDKIIQELEKALNGITDSDTKKSLSEKISKLRQSVSSMPSLDISDLSSNIGTIKGEIDKLQAEIKKYNTSSQLGQLSSQITSFETELGKLQKMMNEAQNKAFYQANGNDSFGFETDSKKFKSLNGYKMKGVTFDNSELSSSSFIPKHTYFYQNSANVAKFLDTNSPFSTPLSQDDIAYLNPANNSSSTAVTRQSILGAMNNAYTNKKTNLTTSNLINLINGINLVSTVSSSKKESKGLKAPTIDDAKRAMSFYKQILDDLTKNTSLQDKDKQEVLKAISDAICNIYRSIPQKAEQATLYTQIIGLRKLLVQQQYCKFMSDVVDKTFSTFNDNIDMSALCDLFNLNFDNNLKIRDGEQIKPIDYAKDLEALHKKFELIKGNATKHQEINDYCYTLLKVIDTVSKNKGDFSNPDAVLETARKQLREVLPHVKNYTSSDGPEVNVATLRNVAMDFELVALEDDIQQGKKSDEEIAKELQAAAGLIFSNPEANEKELALISNETTTTPTAAQQVSFITVLTEVYLNRNTDETTREKALTYLKAMMKTYDSTKDADGTIKAILQKAIGNVINDYKNQISNSSMNKENIVGELKKFVEMKPELLTTDHIKKIIDIVKDIQQYHDETVENKLKAILTTLLDKEISFEVKENIGTFFINQDAKNKESIKESFNNWCDSVFETEKGNTIVKQGANIAGLIRFCKQHTEMELTPDQLQALAGKVEYTKENETAIKQLIELAKGNKDVINTIMEKLKGAGDDVVKAVFESLKNAVFTGSGTDTKLVDGVNTNDVIALCAKQDKPGLTPEQLQALADKVEYKEENKETIKQLIELANGNKEVINTIMEKLKGENATVTAEMLDSLVLTMFTTSGDGANATTTLKADMEGLVPSFIALCAKAKQQKQIDAKYLQALAGKVGYTKENEAAIIQLIKLAKDANATKAINTIMEKLNGENATVTAEMLKSLVQTMFTTTSEVPPATTLKTGMEGLVPSFIALCEKHKDVVTLTSAQLQALADKVGYTKGNEAAIKNLLGLAQGNSGVAQIIIKNIFDKQLQNILFETTGEEEEGSLKLAGYVNANDVIAVCAEHKDVVTLTPDQLKALAGKVGYTKGNEAAIKNFFTLLEKVKDDDTLSGAVKTIVSSINLPNELEGLTDLETRLNALKGGGKTVKDNDPPVVNEETIEELRRKVNSMLDNETGMIKDDQLEFIREFRDNFVTALNGAANADLEPDVIELLAQIKDPRFLDNADDVQLQAFVSIGNTDNAKPIFISRYAMYLLAKNNANDPSNNNSDKPDVYQYAQNVLFDSIYYLGQYYGDQNEDIFANLQTLIDDNDLRKVLENQLLSRNANDDDDRNAIYNAFVLMCKYSNFHSLATSMLQYVNQADNKPSEEEIKKQIKSVFGVDDEADVNAIFKCLIFVIDIVKQQANQ